LADADGLDRAIESLTRYAVDSVRQLAERRRRSKPFVDAV
jgi:hypothetical protein